MSLLCPRLVLTLFTREFGHVLSIDVPPGEGSMHADPGAVTKVPEGRDCGGIVSTSILQ